MSERSIAQKEADKRYAEKIKGQHKHFGINLKNEEYDKVCELIEQAKMTKADFLRWAVNQLEKSLKKQ